MTRSLIHLVLMALVLVAAVAGYGFWYSVLSAKSAAVAQLQEQIDAKNATASYIASARAALAEIAGDEAAVQAYFVSESGVVGFINDLETRGTTLGTSVSVLSVSADKTATHPALDLSIIVSGSFDAVMRTVGSIEYAPYDISITSLSLSKKDKTKWNATVHLLVGSAPNAAAHVSGASSARTQPSAPSGNTSSPALKQ